MNKYYKDQYDVIIIGASLAGLTSAIELSKQGYDVLVLEQHNLPGGVATSFVRGGVEIEASLHEMMSIGEKEFPLKVRKYFEENNINVDWVRLPIAFRYIAPDYNVLIHAGKNGDFSVPAKEIADECDDKDGSVYNQINDFFKLCLRVYNSLNEVSKNPKMSKMKIVKEHPDFTKTLGYSFIEVCEALKLPKRAIDILSAYWMYIGSPMDEMPFTVYAYLLADYLGYGSYIPKHTSHEMALKLLDCAERNGAQVEFNQKVANILVKNNKVTGVKLKNNTIINTNYVISGAYPNTVYSKMIEPKSELPRRAIKVTNSMDIGVSCFSLVMLLDKDYHEFGFKDYATFYAPHGMDTRKFYDNGKKYHNWDYLTSVCTNIAHEGASPKGTCIYTTTYLPNGESFKDTNLKEYEKHKKQLVDHFLDNESERLGVNLREHILEMVIETPLTISHYVGAYMGSIYGFRHKVSNHTIARSLMDKEEKLISGLAFSGAHGIAGDGMATAITNGIEGAKDIIKEMNKRKGEK